MICKNNRSIDMKPNEVKNSDFMSILYSKHSENTKSPNLELEIEFAFPSIIYFSGKVINHNIHKKNLKMFPLLSKNLEHTHSKTNTKTLYLGNSTRRTN